MWKALLGAVAAAVVLATTGSAAATAGLAGGMPAGWTHAEINFVVNRVPHTLVLDRGRVTAVSAASLTILEQDGNSVQVALAPTTQVILDGRPGQLSDIRRGAVATTQQIDGGAAREVRVHVPPRLARLARR
jgi:hypothetical protein